MWKREKKKTKNKKEFRRVSPSNDSEERDEMELCCNTGQEKERSKTSRETKKKGEKKNTLEREEKQPDGMTVNPFSSIWKERKWKKGERI